MRSSWFQHFKVSKKPGFKMPPCRHRIIIAPPMTEHVASEPIITVGTAPPFEVDSPIQSSKTANIQQEEKQTESADEAHIWLAQRLKIKRDLDTFVNLQKWVYCKPRTTRSEKQVLRKIYRDQENERAAQRAAEIASAAKIKPARRVRRNVPSLDVPEPPCLSVLYEYLFSHKIKVVEMFWKGDWEHQTTREEFVEGMKSVGAPLTEQEFEDVVIFLSSRNKNNIIYREDLVASYKCWVTAKKNEIQEERKNFNSWKSRLRRHFAKPNKVKILTPPPSSPKPQSGFLEVPPINTEPDRMHLTYEDMEEAGKRYREMRQRAKKKINPLLFMERCRLVRTGIKAYDDHCLPSTLKDEFGELTNAFRQATFLAYLKCVKACEIYKVPLTEKILMKGKVV